ncbi:MAG: hypothetical protein ACR2GR_09480 [Rhodothermales bacterium]
MKTLQKALILLAGPEKTQGLDELNLELERGWHVAHVAPMGGTGLGEADTGPRWAALVVIEHREDRASAAVLEQAEEEVSELLEELAEGDGGLEIREGRIGGGK